MSEATGGEEVTVAVRFAGSVAESELKKDNNKPCFHRNSNRSRSNRRGFGRGRSGPKREFHGATKASSGHMLAGPAEDPSIRQVNHRKTIEAKYFPHCTVWKHIATYLGFSLQSLTEHAAQQCEMTRNHFKYVLEITIHNNPELLVMVDETHRDRNAARRRRGYGKRNSGGLKLKRWFKTIARCAMIGVADANGFIDSACETYIRQDLSDEGAAGRVTREIFEQWVEEKLCPVLGNYSIGEPRSAVMLDNASTHMSEKVVRLIEGKGAVMLFAAPFSPDLNPIENFFSAYKRYLKKHNDDMIRDWERAHLEALGSVNRDMGIKHYCRCGIPGAKKLKTSEEKRELNNELIIAIIILMITNGYFN